MTKYISFKWIFSIPFRIIRKLLFWVLADQPDEETIFGRFPNVIFDNKNIVIGDRVYIGPGSYFGGKSKIAIGHDSMIARNVAILTNSHDYLKNPMWQVTVFRPIEIGNYVWIGYGVTILQGVKIGDNAIIGAGSVITKHVPSNSVVGGNPARIIRFRNIPEISMEIQQKFPFGTMFLKTFFRKII